MNHRISLEEIAELLSKKELKLFKLDGEEINLYIDMQYEQ